MSILWLPVDMLSLNMYLLLSALLFTVAVTELTMDKNGCGTTKACLLKPAGCDPNLDCTIGIMLYMTGPNQLRIEMVAQTLIPVVQQQYVAVAFSHDPVMGDDAVTECVMSNMGQFAGWEPEIYASFNKGKSNDRVYLNNDEHRTLISNISSEVVDDRLVCHFTQQIVPQIDKKNGLLWNLDKSFYIMGATGSAQPDEVNAHDMNRGSHFYPIISPKKINPSLVGDIQYDLPPDVNNRPRRPTTIPRPTVVVETTQNIASTPLIVFIFIFTIIRL